MRRRTFDYLVSWGGLVLAVVLLVAGGLLTWGWHFSTTEVHDQLAAQKISFPATIDPKTYPLIPQEYAGQQVVNGAQAKAFADGYIAVHLSETAGGKTYSEVSSEWIAGGMKDAKLASQRETLFMGETLRGMLLNAYAWWQVGQIALFAAIGAFVAGAILLVLSILGFVHARRVPADAELGAGTSAPKEELVSA